MARNKLELEGYLLNTEPTKICQHEVRGRRYMKLHLNKMCGLTEGEQVFQVRLKNGCVLIIPESVMGEIKIK